MYIMDWHKIVQDNIGFKQFIRENYTNYSIDEEIADIADNCAGGSTSWSYIENWAINKLSQEELKNWFIKWSNNLINK